MTELSGQSVASAVKWEWYKYHADQRLRTFNFFVLVVGALLLLEESSFAPMHPVLTRFAMGFGFVVSLGFLGLDVRNAFLLGAVKAVQTNDENDELSRLIMYRDHERVTWQDVMPMELETVRWTHNSVPTWLDNLTRHKFVLRSILSLAALVFLALTIRGPH